MSYTALYRKFRPQNFAEVRGQDVIVTTLTNQLRADRIGHAYLFCGTRGTGKTSIAKILARAVNCEHPTPDGPCNECDRCRSILAGNSTNVIEIDAASNNGVDNVRELREEVAYRPTEGKYKVYIIDEVHMMSKEAFNALLKTLEEPPSYVIFILATTEAGKVPVTILSRCQRYDFHRISSDVIAGRLAELVRAEGAQAEDAALRYIARAGDGSMRDALSLLDQCIAASPDEILTYDRTLRILGAADTEVFARLLACVHQGDAAGSIRILAQLAREGKEMEQITADFTWYLRDLLLLASSDDLEDVIDVSGETLEMMRQSVGTVSTDALLRYIRVLSDLSGQLRTASQKRVLVETTLIRLCRPEMSTNKDAILDRIRQLEEKLARGVPVQAIPAQAQAAAGQEGTPAAEAADAQQMPPEEPAAPVRAAPEDLQAIAAAWEHIAAKAPTAVMRMYMQKLTPQYDAEQESETLFLSTADGNTRYYFSEHPDHAEHTEEIRVLIRNVTGKDTQIELTGAAEVRKLTDLPREDHLAERINMPIEEAPDDAFD